MSNVFMAPMRIKALNLFICAKFLVILQKQLSCDYWNLRESDQKNLLGAILVTTRKLH